MTYTILLLAKRKPCITSEQFQDHWDNKHIPLLKSLSGAHFPNHHIRRYFARTERPGFGGLDNPDHPLLMLRGSPDDCPYDAVAELEFQSEKAFHNFYKAIYEPMAAAKIAEDEERFLDRGKLKAVVVGTTTATKK